jgi:hypothetical protein
MGSHIVVVQALLNQCSTPTRYVWGVVGCDVGRRSFGEQTGADVTSFDGVAKLFGRRNESM